MNSSSEGGYRWLSAQPEPSHTYLLPTVLRELETAKARLRGKLSVFDLGCGNGSVANALAQNGWSVSGVDPSAEGIRLANETYPTLQLHVGSAYDDLADQYGRFPVVLSLEVVEHLYSPRAWAKTLASLLEPGGLAMISTPYHGYLKNVALAISGHMDVHFTALWDHGHIKFWSMRTLRILLEEAGFTEVRFVRVGRIPALAKSLIAFARLRE